MHLSNHASVCSFFFITSIVIFRMRSFAIFFQCPERKLSYFFNIKTLSLHS